jgi:hypothetical protein
LRDSLTQRHHSARATISLNINQVAVKSGHDLSGNDVLETLNNDG